MTLEEMFTKLWFAYPTDLCKGKRGGKQPAFQAFKKIKPDEDEFKRILGNMDAQIRADRKDKDAYRWPFVSTYLNQRRYDDVIETQTENRESQKLSICNVANCSNPVHGSSFSMCTDHVPSDWDDRLRAAWKATGLDRKSPTLRQDCREYINKLGYGSLIK